MRALLCRRSCASGIAWVATLATRLLAVPTQPCGHRLPEGGPRPALARCLPAG